MLNLKGCSLYQVGKTMQLLAVKRKGLTIFCGRIFAVLTSAACWPESFTTSFCHREVQTILRQKISQRCKPVNTLLKK